MPAMAKKTSRWSIVTLAKSKLKLTEPVTDRPYWFGDRISLFNAYFPVTVCWYPRQALFRQHTPKIVTIAENVRQRAELVRVVGR